MLTAESPICFQVINVDDDGNELGSGVMELTDAELVLHTHRRDDVRWPYLCLRRYGYDSNLFSFESGRRCQTGQGTGGKPGFTSCLCRCDVIVVGGVSPLLCRQVSLPSNVLARRRSSTCCRR